VKIANANQNGCHPDPDRELAKGQRKDLLCIFIVPGETAIHLL
jgi:hypothetical protein